MRRTCRVGVHGRNNEVYQELDYRVIQDSEVEAIKVMSQTKPSVLERIKRENYDIEIITRLYDPRVGEGHHPSPAEFADKMIPIMKSYQPYCEKFHLLNEPNHSHRYEGWGATLEDARSFNAWYLEAFDRLKQTLPWASLGFPGLAVPLFEGAHGSRQWLEICRPSVEISDWLGCHCYWQTPIHGRSVIFDENFGQTHKYYHRMFPDKTIEILECGNSNVQNGIPISDDDVAREFIDWLNEVFKYRYINSVAYFILSSQDRGNWEFFSWRKEDGYVKPIVKRLDAFMDRIGDQRAGVITLPPPPPAPREQVEIKPEPQDPSEVKSVPSAGDGEVTNQNMIDAMYNVNQQLGYNGPWDLLAKAGLSLGVLAGNRDAKYDGPELSQLKLSPDERRLVREELDELVPDAATAEVTFTNQNVIDAFYQAGRKLGLNGAWDLLGKAGLSLGGLAQHRNALYGGQRISTIRTLREEEKNFVKLELKIILGLSESDALPSFAIGETTTMAEPKVEYLQNHPNLGRETPLAPADSEQLPLNKASTTLERRTLQTWNRYGWLLTIVSDVLEIDLTAVVALVAVENDERRGLSNDGKLLVRFDPHIFLNRWGEENLEQFEQHFQVDASKPWQGHRYRAKADGKWLDLHKNQSNEQAALITARDMNETAALEATSMGTSTIMGFNHALLGYHSVEDMYAAFASSEVRQIVGYFDFLAGRDQDSRPLDALRDNDFDAYAALSHSGSELGRYVSQLHTAANAFRKYRAVG